MHLEVTPEEQEIFDMITSCTPQGVVARVAGGWVRDKLMNVQCFDMDIALENMTGHEFVNILIEKHKPVTSIYVVPRNPEKSKHLETASCNIKNISVDFVNLRNEQYTDTRIPTMKMGTPVEDAYRRDLTINSLFYNLNTKQVEDFTDQGINDFVAKVLRTPLDPYITFSDDPLRIIRVFRFKAKLNFDFAEEIDEALKQEELKEMLKCKVSRERIRTELFKMVGYDKGYYGIYEVIRHRYVFAIFGLEVDYNVLMHTYNRFLQMYDHFSELKDRWMYNLYIVLLPSSGTIIRHDKKILFLNCKVCKYDLMAENKTVIAIREVEEGLCKVKHLNVKCLDRYNVVFIVQSVGEYWRIILFLEYIRTDCFDLISLISHIDRYDLGYKKARPIQDMHCLDETLAINKRYISYFAKECVIYQLAYPDNKDILQYFIDCKDEIIAKHDTLHKSCILE